MKTLLATLAIATATSAAAIPSTEATRINIERYAGSVDVSKLSRTEIATIETLIHSGGTHSETVSKVKALVRRFQD